MELEMKIDKYKNVKARKRKKPDTSPSPVTSLDRDKMDGQPSYSPRPKGSA